MQRFLPGLDLANELRQMHERRDHIGALKHFRTLTGSDLATAVSWYKGLTGWQSATDKAKPKPITRAELAAAFRSFAHRLGDRAEGETRDTFRALIAVEAQAFNLADDLDGEAS